MLQCLAGFADQHSHSHTRTEGMKMRAVLGGQMRANDNSGRERNTTVGVSAGRRLDTRYEDASTWNLRGCPGVLPRSVSKMTSGTQHAAELQNWALSARTAHMPLNTTTPLSPRRETLPALFNKCHCFQYTQWRPWGWVVSCRVCPATQSLSLSGQSYKV
jgi:hypothetical protein